MHQQSFMPVLILDRFAWELLWLTGPICILMFASLPETSAANILLRRARRLRLLTGKINLKSQSEIDQEKMTATEIAFDALIKPWQINILDPAVVSSMPTVSNLALIVSLRLSLPYTLHLYTESSIPFSRRFLLFTRLCMASTLENLLFPFFRSLWP